MKTKLDFLEQLRQKAGEITNNKINSKDEPWNNLDIRANIKGESFRRVYSVGNWVDYYYYISNIGRVAVINIKDANIENQDEIVLNEHNVNNSNCWIIPIKNGYLTAPKSEYFPKNLKITQYTDAYKFTIEAGWLNDESKILSLKIVENNIKNAIYKNDRIELHHIDNNPSNNNIDNLIWLPKSIHQTVH